jgi:putative ABC transport system permease protein
MRPLQSMPSIQIGPIFRSLLRNRARFVLIVVEVALTLAIVANSIVLILDARRTIARQSGFDDEHLLVVQSQPFARALRERDALGRSAAADASLLRSQPGVAAATLTSFYPWAGGGSQTSLKLPGTKDQSQPAQIYLADTEIVRTLGVRLVSGRTFTQDEVERSVADSTGNLIPGVLLSRALADRLYPQQDALGKSIEISDGTGKAPVVGVIDRFYNPYGGKNNVDELAFFIPGRAASYGRGTLYLVRTSGVPARLAPALEKALLKAENGRNVRILTLTEVRANYHGGNRILVASLDAVMALLVVVTALGIIGITSFSVAERRRQIGTRRALGATRWEVVRHFLVENWLVTSIGIVLGLGVAFGLNVGLVAFIAGARLGWQVLAAGALLLWTIGLASALGPALRAAQVAPAIATRNV